LISYEPIIQRLTVSQSQQVDILRLDLIDQEISGNKWFKLKLNLEKARSENFETVITFGGAFSNHIAATAAACKKFNLNCIGIIRGEEKDASNFTLSRASANGMSLHFVSREFYSHRTSEEFKNYLQNNFGRHYLIPEGGNNEKGVLGCTEILRPEWKYDYLVCACGTATTYAGLVAGKNDGCVAVGISVLKGENKLPADVGILLTSMFPGRKISIAGNETQEEEFIKEDCILSSYSFKGYAKLEPALLKFKSQFEAEFKIPLDHVYTVKLMYGLFDLLNRDKLKPGSRILAIHSGGLQGNKGFEERYHLSPSL